MTVALSAALAGVLLLSVALMPLALWGFATATGLPGRWLYLALAALVAEDVWTMFFRVRRSGLPRPIPNGSMALVGYAFVGVFYVTLADFRLLRDTPQPAWWHVAAGLVVVAAAKALHYWSTSHLRRHAGAADDASSTAPTSLIRTGPYRRIRHPMYTAACLEAAGLPIVFGSWWALAFALVVFVPLEYYRAVVEERALRDHFGDDYRAYARTAARLFAWPFTGRNTTERKPE